MDDVEFVSLVKQTKLKLYSIRFAYRALVLGDKNGNVANVYGVKRQLVEQAKKRVLRQQKIEKKIPDTWGHVSVHLPIELIEVVKWIEKESKYNNGLLIKRSKKVPELSVETIELLSNVLCSK
jgi:hypothetical protein